MTKESTIEQTLFSVLQELKDLKIKRDSLEDKIEKLAQCLISRDKKVELAELSNPVKEEAKMLKYQGISIHKSPKGNMYYTRYRVGKKQYYISAYTQRECYEKLKKAKSPTNVAKLLASQDIISNDISFDVWYNQWLTLYKIGKVKEETLRSYRSLYKAIPDDFKEKAMREIKLMDLLTLMQSYPSERQQQKFYEFINMIMQKAEDNDIIPKNLMKKVDKPKHKKVHSQALTSDQQKQLIEACSKIPNADVILVSLYQGFRRGEVLGLTRDCVDLEKKTITINKAWSQRNKFDTTKNEQSIRTEPMFENTYNILVKYRDKKSSERIFNLSTKQYETLLGKVRIESGLTAIKMKDMRSTFITNCMNMNIPIHIIQAWVGHTLGSVVTTSVYTTHNSEADIEYIKQINEKFKN